MAKALEGSTGRTVFTQQISVVRPARTSSAGDAFTQFGEQMGRDRRANEAEDERRLMRRASTAISNANLAAEKAAPNDPEAYKKIYNDSINAFLKTSKATDVQAEAIIGSATITRNAGETSRLRDIARNEKRNDLAEFKSGVTAAQNELMRAIRRGNPEEIAAKRLEWDMLVGGAISSEIITAEESIAFVDSVDAESVSAHLRSGFDAAEDKQAYMERNIARERANPDSPLSVEQIDKDERWMQAGIDDTQRRLEKQAREAKKAFDQGQEDQFNKANARIIALKDDPTSITAQEIEDMDLGDKYKNRLRLNYEARVGGLKAAEARAALLDDALAGRAVLSPGDSAHKKAMNEWYDGALDRVKQLPEDQQEQARGMLIAEGVARAVRVGIVPQGVKNEIVGRLVLATQEGADPVLATAAAGLLQQLNEVPGLSAQFNPKAITVGVRINELQRIGYSPEQAVQTAAQEANVDDITKVERKAEYTAGDFDKKATTHLQGMSDRVWGSDVAITSTATGEFKALVQTEYRRMGDIDAAIASAEKQFNGLWAVTKVGASSRWMKLAPEAYYAVPGQSSEWMAEEFGNHIRSKFPDFKGDVQEEFIISSDRTTRLRTVTRKDTNSGKSVTTREPDYPVLRRNEFGHPEAVMNEDGTPMRWSPDWDKSAANGRLKAQRERDLRDAEQAIVGAIEKTASTMGHNLEKGKALLKEQSRQTRIREERQAKEKVAESQARKGKENALKAAMEAHKPILGN